MNCSFNNLIPIKLSRLFAFKKDNFKFYYRIKYSSNIRLFIIEIEVIPEFAIEYSYIHSNIQDMYDLDMYYQQN